MAEAASARATWCMRICLRWRRNQAPNGGLTATLEPPCRYDKRPWEPRKTGPRKGSAFLGLVERRSQTWERQ